MWEKDALVSEEQRAALPHHVSNALQYTNQPETLTEQTASGGSVIPICRIAWALLALSIHNGAQWVATHFTGSGSRKLVW
ncbi:hypothetical protein XELAEV_18035262mg [Xenopus laevis]|uniref:Uncharacterized protein n=1 Tax=Xenopus laevis TaxID=8355 RepID=A0A974HBY6_XENLA|nr:hypothetical protein XELAEV_18035262mg [Xenopus laevis]